LYLKGGVYLDIKFMPVNGFSFGGMTDQEYLCKDRPAFFTNKNGIYNGFMVLKAGNAWLAAAIKQIYANCVNKFYGHNILYPTGPGLLGEIIPNSYKYSLTYNANGAISNALGKPVLSQYAGYRNDQNSANYYSTLYKNKGIYKVIPHVVPAVVPVVFELPDVSQCDAIPRVIYQTWGTKALPPGMTDAVKQIKAANPGFRHELFDDADCRAFIEQNFPAQVLYAYDSLIPGAYKADLWRYCILYLKGGIYLDIKFVPINGFSFGSMTDQEHFCLDTPTMPKTGISVYNAFMVVRPGNDAMKQCIQTIYQHVRSKFYGEHALEPTGPHLLGKFIKMKMCSCINTFDSVTLNNKKLLAMYSSYRKDQEHYYLICKTTHYRYLWKNNQVYVKN
jgi:mannosyltransferase OCH1-like enzyme